MKMTKKSALSRKRETKAYKIFKYFNYVILWVLAASCVLPMVHILALSLSTRTPAWWDCGRAG